MQIVAGANYRILLDFYCPDNGAWSNGLNTVAFVVNVTVPVDAPDTPEVSIGPGEAPCMGSSPRLSPDLGTHCLTGQLRHCSSTSLCAGDRHHPAGWGTPRSSSSCTHQHAVPGPLHAGYAAAEHCPGIKPLPNLHCWVALLNEHVALRRAMQRCTICAGLPATAAALNANSTLPGAAGGYSDCSDVPEELPMLVAEAFLDSNETFSGEPFTGCANYTAKLSQACCQVGLRAGGRYFALYLGLPSLARLSIQCNSLC